MVDFNHHGHIKWDTQQSTGVDYQNLLCLVQDNFLTQHVLEPTRAARVLYIVLSSQKEFVDNVDVQEPLGSSDHNQLHFNITIKSDKTNVKQCRGDFRRGDYEDIGHSLALTYYLGYGFSPVDASLGVLTGRPYGGVGFVWTHAIDEYVSIIDCDYDWLCCIKVSNHSKDFYLLNVYM